MGRVVSGDREFKREESLKNDWLITSRHPKCTVLMYVHGMQYRPDKVLRLVCIAPPS